MRYNPLLEPAPALGNAGVDGAEAVSEVEGIGARNKPAKLLLLLLLPKPWPELDGGLTETCKVPETGS